MKARVIETNEIVELQEDMNSDYFTKDGVHFKGFELNFDIEQPDYWEKLKHQYAGMAMQGILANNDLMEFLSDRNKDVALSKIIVDNANIAAVALINKLKEEEKCEK